jgi:hypothetical protein
MKRRYVVVFHVGYWLSYLMLLMLVLALAARRPDRPHPLPSELLLSTAGYLATIPTAVAFYVAYWVLCPRFLAPRRFVALVGASVATALGSAALGLALLYLIAGPVPRVFVGTVQIVGVGIMVALAGLTHMIIACVIRGFIGWYDDVRVKEDLLRKTHEVELALVRSRLDPHFLFNTLNNIDVLITKDPPRASAYLNELSDLMRFVLYGARQERIPLAEELGFIEKYVRLEQLRVAKSGFIVHDVVGSPGAITIAPMSFVPFIENAFKHSAGQREGGTITSRVVIEAGQVRFECRNRHGPGRTSATNGGLGNDLIRRRLELLYPGRHALEVSDRDGVYTVRLSLDVDDHLHHR